MRRDLVQDWGHAVGAAVLLARGPPSSAGESAPSSRPARRSQAEVTISHISLPAGPSLRQREGSEDPSGSSRHPGPSSWTVQGGASGEVPGTSAAAPARRPQSQTSSETVSSSSPRSAAWSGPRGREELRQQLHDGQGHWGQVGVVADGRLCRPGLAASTALRAGSWRGWTPRGTPRTAARGVSSTWSTVRGPRGPKWS
jgi:hypothetical protein